MAEENGERDEPGMEGEVIALQESQPQSSMNMYLNTQGLQFKLDTRIDHSAQEIALAAKLELLTGLFDSYVQKLDAAMIRIGQLEAELLSCKRAGNVKE